MKDKKFKQIQKQLQIEKQRLKKICELLENKQTETDLKNLKRSYSVTLDFISQLQESLMKYYRK